MRKYTITLFDSIMNRSTHKKVGNHSMEKGNNSYKFKFHNNTIMEVNFKEKLIYLNDCGYKTISTTQAINSHLDGLESYMCDLDGFTIIDLSQGKRFIDRVKLTFRDDDITIM